MKKIIGFLMFLILGIFILSPTKVFANSVADLNADEWYNHISQHDYGIAIGEVLTPSEWWENEKFYIFIIAEPSGDVDGIIEYDGRFVGNEDLNYFEPRLRNVIRNWAFDGFYFDFETVLLNVLGQTNFDGFLYWNFFEKYWQIDYFEISEEDYYNEQIEFYKQRILVLENLVTNLTNQLHSRNIEIQLLNGEINTLLNEIQYLENALESEYDRGYTEGVLVNYAEAYQEGFKAGEKSKLIENNQAFYNGIEKWLVPAIITVIALGGFVTIASIKRREQ